jgi:flagellin-like hook-associated protein FlgL
MSSSITLSAGVRQNLLALQDTAALLATTQNRLATGKKVNSALDNPTNFFTSQGLSNRASDLNSLLDTIGQAQQTLQAANTGLTSLTSLVQSAKSIATQAEQSSKGGVNYTYITGSVAIALDSTQATSSASTVAAAGAVSTEATANINAAGIGQLANGDLLKFTLGSGATITATFGAATSTATNTFHDAAGLISVLNTGTGTSGNFGTTATAASDGAGGVTVTSADVSNNFTTAFTSAGLSGANFTTTALSLGDALTITDGTHTNTFYRVASTAPVSAAAGTYNTAATLAAAINSAANQIHSTITGAASGTGIQLSSGNNVGITVSGNTGTALGFNATQYLNNFNSTLNGLTGTVSVTVGSDPANVLTFGSGNGQISLKSQLDATLATLTDITGATDSGRHVNFTPTSSSNVTVGGTNSVLTALGLSAGTTTPVATVVTPNSTRTNLQSQYNALLTQIDQLAGDSSYNGVNLLTGDNLKVTFNETGTSSLTISGVKFDSAGLGLTAISGTGFQDNHVIDTTLTSVQTALTSLRTQASAFGSTLSTVQTRNDFTKNLVNVLQTGSDNLVLADTNEEGANLLALQTRQSLSTTALSLANQSNQAVLKLLG